MDQAVNHEDPEHKEEPEPQPRRAVRIEVDLTQCNSLGYPVFDYQALLREAQKKEDGEAAHGTAMGGSSKVAGTSQCAVDENAVHDKTYAMLGAGYDVEDSFIDDTEAIDEGIPEYMDTRKGGFYINSGPIELKKKNAPSSPNGPDNTEGMRRQEPPTKKPCANICLEDFVNDKEGIPFNPALAPGGTVDQTIDYVITSALLDDLFLSSSTNSSESVTYPPVEDTYPLLESHDGLSSAISNDVMLSSSSTWSASNEGPARSSEERSPQGLLTSDSTSNSSSTLHSDGSSGAGFHEERSKEKLDLIQADLPDIHDTEILFLVNDVLAFHEESKVSDRKKLNKLLFRLEFQCRIKLHYHSIIKVKDYICNRLSLDKAYLRRKMNTLLIKKLAKDHTLMLNSIRKLKNDSKLPDLRALICPENYSPAAHQLRNAVLDFIKAKVLFYKLSYKKNDNICNFLKKIIIEQILPIWDKADVPIETIIFHLTQPMVEYAESLDINSSYLKEFLNNAPPTLNDMWHGDDLSGLDSIDQDKATEPPEEDMALYNSLGINILHLSEASSSDSDNPPELTF